LLAILFFPGVGSIALAQELKLSAQAAVLMEASSGEVIYEKNMHTPLPMASITKIMTLVLALEAVETGKARLDDLVTTSEYANKMGRVTNLARSWGANDPKRYALCYCCGFG